MDGDLIRRRRSGDFEAFLELVRPGLTGFRAFVAFHAPPGLPIWDYDDIAQEALLRAYQRPGSFDAARGDLGAWLFGVARNVIRRAWREAARRSRAGETEAFRIRQAAAERALERDLRMDPVLEALERCLRRLPERSSALLRAHYEQGLAPVEIAGTFSMTANAVYVVLHRLRRALRRCMRAVLSPGGAL